MFYKDLIKLAVFLKNINEILNIYYVDKIFMSASKCWQILEYHKHKWYFSFIFIHTTKTNVSRMILYPWKTLLNKLWLINVMFLLMSKTHGTADWTIQ